MHAMDTTPLHPDLHAAARRRAHELRDAAIAAAIDRLLAFLFRRRSPAPCHS